MPILSEFKQKTLFFRYYLGLGFIFIAIIGLGWRFRESRLLSYDVFQTISSFPAANPSEANQD